MTVSSTASRVVHTGNGVTTIWPFAFKVDAAADLVVIYSAANVDTTLSPAQYTAVGFGDDAGGTVTYPLVGSPIAIGTRLTILRDVPVTQPAEVSNQGAMWPVVLEQALDRLTYIAQRAADMASRSLRVTPTDGTILNLLPPATERANGLLGFDAQGQPYAATGVGGTAVASTWVALNWFPVTSPGAGRAVLDVPSTGDLTTAVAAAIPKATLSAKGSLVGASAAGAPVDLPVGAAGSVLMARSAASTGLSWMPALAGMINGLAWSNNVSDATNDIDIAAGGCMDDTAASWISVPALVKRLDAVWVVGTGQGGLDTGAIANTDYFMWAIGRTDTGAGDVLFSTSSSAPTLPTGYTFKRRIGWIRRSAGAILGFTTFETAGGGISFAWRSPPRDFSASVDVTRSLLSLSVPNGFQVEAELDVTATIATALAGVAIDIVCPDRTDEAPALSGSTLGNAGGASSVALTGGDQSVNGVSVVRQAQLRVRTSTAQQIAARATAACSVDAQTVGFRWERRP